MRPATPPRPWAPQFAPSVPLINDMGIQLGILLLTHAGCMGPPRDRVSVGPRSPIVYGHAFLFAAQEERKQFCKGSVHSLPPAIARFRYPVPISTVRRVRRPVQRCTSYSLSRHSKDLQRPLSSVKHGAGGRKGMPQDILRTRWRRCDKF